jgi:hypothetical protein
MRVQYPWVPVPVGKIAILTPGQLNLGFITEGKLAAIFIKTFSWGFPTGRSFTTYVLVNLAQKFSVAVAVY